MPMPAHPCRSAELGGPGDLLEVSIPETRIRVVLEALLAEGRAEDLAVAERRWDRGERARRCGLVAIAIDVSLVQDKCTDHYPSLARDLVGTA